MISCADLIVLTTAHDRYWMSHYYLTKSTIEALVSGKSCAVEAINLLYKNQKDLGSSFGQLTGSADAQNNLTDELSANVALEIEIVNKALKGNNSEKKKDLLLENATKIATIYSLFNTNLDFITMEEMMLNHIGATFELISAIVADKCEDISIKGNILLANVNNISSYINSGFLCL